MYSEEGFFGFVLFFLIFIFGWDIRKYLYYTLSYYNGT